MRDISCFAFALRDVIACCSSWGLDFCFVFHSTLLLCIRTTITTAAHICYCHWWRWLGFGVQFPFRRTDEPNTQFWIFTGKGNLLMDYCHKLKRKCFSQTDNIRPYQRPRQQQELMSQLWLSMGSRVIHNRMEKLNSSKILSLDGWSEKVNEIMEYFVKLWIIFQVRFVI